MNQKEKMRRNITGGKTLSNPPGWFSELKIESSFFTGRKSCVIMLSGYENLL